MTLFDKSTTSNIQKQEFSAAESYEHNMLDQRYADDRLRCHMAVKFGVFVNEGHGTISHVLLLILGHVLPLSCP